MKNLLTALCCLLILALLCSCTAPSLPETDTQTGAHEISVDNNLQPKFYQFTGFLGDNYLFPLAGNEKGSFISAVISDSVDEQGMPINSESGPAREMLYIDYAKGEIAPLEGHELSGDDLFSQFLCVGDYLYGFYCGGPREDIPNYIFRTGLDGKSRQQYDLPQGWKIRFPSGVIYDQGCFYLIIYFESREADKFTLQNNLLKLNPETGDIFMQELPSKWDSYWSLRGYCEDGYLLSSYNPDDPNADSIGNVFYVFNIKDKSLTSCKKPIEVPAENDIFVKNSVYAHQLSDIVAETETQYLIFVGYEPSSGKYMGIEKGNFPAFALIDKANYQEIHQIF